MVNFTETIEQSRAFIFVQSDNITEFYMFISLIQLNCTNIGFYESQAIYEVLFTLTVTHLLNATSES